jgi:hypothetical protein
MIGDFHRIRQVGRGEKGPDYYSYSASRAGILHLKRAIEQEGYISGICRAPARRVRVWAQT